MDIDIAADYKIEREWKDLEFEGKSKIVDILRIQTTDRIALDKQKKINAPTKSGTGLPHRDEKAQRF